MVTTKGSVFNMLRWQWTHVRWYLTASLAVYAVHWMFPLHGWLTPAPVAVVGGAIGIFASFRTNSAYDRWWEGRKLWGRLINTSRMWSSQAVAYIADEGLKQELVRRHIAYVHLLRCLLRKQNGLADEDVRRFLTEEELTWLATQTNQTHALLDKQLGLVAREQEAGRIDALRLQSFDESIKHLLDIQGGCERIKKTPLPRGYGFAAELLIDAYAILLPVAIVDDVGILSIPMTVFVCLAFGLISEVGRVLEDPFSVFWNGLPLFAMSKTIEHNLRNRIGETELPPLPVPDENGVLM